MSKASLWWRGDQRERFWLESTDRPDIGVDLRAPLADGGGADNWRYSLFQQAEVGDLVFHYDKRRAAISAVSRISGPPQPSPIVWAARGSYARDRGAEPTESAGYRIALDQHQPLLSPLTLEDMRTASSAIRTLHDALKNRVGKPLYFPFELSARPIRPLQGYAFKLPADFVAAFPALQSAVAETVAVGRTDGLEGQRGALRQAMEMIEAAASGYRIGGLQRLRTQLRGLKRTASSIFGTRTLSQDWAFHHGGRDELQFNIGLDVMADAAPAFRTGVAFSFEPSRSLPDLDVLVPKVARFNAWMREHPEAFADLSMWHYRAGQRSDDYRPAPIPAHRVRADTFVFLGDRQAIGAVDPHRALRTMDRLLPLYEWVEGGGAAEPRLASVDIGGLRLEDGRHIDGGHWITASTPERTLNIYLRHRELQRRLREILESEGCLRAATEVPLGLRSIDLVAQHPEGLWFYEVKTGSTARSCLREAIGQLLEYALWPGSVRPVQLVVIGEAPIDDDAATYLERLNQAFPIPLSYRQLSLET